MGVSCYFCNKEMKLQKALGKPFCSRACLMRWLWRKAPKIYEENRLEWKDEQFPPHPSLNPDANQNQTKPTIKG